MCGQMTAETCRPPELPEMVGLNSRNSRYNTMFTFTYLQQIIAEFVPDSNVLTYLLTYFKISYHNVNRK